MRFHKLYFRLQTTIIILVCAILLLALLVTDFLISSRIAENIQKYKTEKTTDIARIIANSPIVIEGLTGHRDEQEIQIFANKIMDVTKVDFITVMDMNGIRKSHPNPANIGKRFVGGDENHVLNGNEHISIAKGTLGVSLRTFVPVVGTDGKQVGAVSVGILLVNITQAIGDSRMTIFTGISLGGLVGLAGAFFLARKIKKILFGLEPNEIARLLEERSAMLQSTREGILAVDQKGSITLVNAEALRLFHQAGIEGEPIGKNVADYLPNSRMNKVLENGQPQIDQEYDLGLHTLMVNRVPISISGKTVGAIATFRDKTEVRKLAEQLTGVQMYVEALRPQAHEFMNKLHVILGMVQLGCYDKLAPYITQIADHHQKEVGFIVRKVKNPVLAGFILGKLSYAREVDTELTLSGDSILPQPEQSEVTHECITIIGNLVDNALDAVQECPRKSVDLYLQYEDNLLTIVVSDTGTGIPEELSRHIFTRGFSTKGDNRGLGLFLVQRSIERLHGTLAFTSNTESGTICTVEIPFVGKDDECD
jgi:two-component system, CitB family, sensor histidine kinase MalK